MSQTPPPAPTTGRRWLRWAPLVVIGTLFVALIASGALKRLSLASLAARLRADGFATLAEAVGAR